jgi:hypothetical protein
MSETLVTKSDRNTIIRSKYRMPIVSALVFLPWLAVILFTTGGWAALNFVAYAVVISAVGYSVMSLALPAPVRTEVIVLAPAVGILAISAVSALWLRLGLPLLWVPALWFAFVAPGALGIWADRKVWMRKTVAYGRTLAVLSAIICAVYFLPVARDDAVLRRDGSFNWIYVDTQHFYAIAAGIKSGESPPKAPGTATEELLYHFGPYVPAAVISRMDGLDLGDALARVTRGASLWALVLSCFGVGTLLSLRANGGGFGGAASVAGLFFYGSLLSLFADERNGASTVTGAVLYKIPGIDVLADGGPFSHLVLGHSMLHGLIAITAIMGLCLAHLERETAVTWRGLMLLVLPALAAPMNSVAALYCVGVAGILLFWGRLRAVKSWLLIVLMVGLFLAAWKIMGYAHAPDAAGAKFNWHLAMQWWPITIAFIVGLGFRIIAFRWIKRPWKDPLSALVLATVVGLLGFSVLLQLDEGNSRYGIYFLQCMFSIFAFSLVRPDFWRGAERSKWTMQWLTLAAKGMALLTGCGIIFDIVKHVSHGQSEIDDIRFKLLFCFFLAFALAGISWLMKRNLHFSAIGSAVLTAVLLIGFFAWIAPWLNFGMGRMKLDVTVSPGEVKGLNRLREIAASNEEFATNKHSVDSLATRRERSYAYAALSQRPVLLEGYLDRGETYLPWFETMLRDNDSMFTTTNPDALRNLASTWHVRWLVARPGTDISLPKPLPAWLVPQQDSGDLKIYRIN